MQEIIVRMIRQIRVGCCGNTDKSSGQTHAGHEDVLMLVEKYLEFLIPVNTGD